MAKSTKLGDVALAMIEKRLLPTGKRGSYRIPGSTEEVRGKEAAVKATIKAAEADDATKTTRHVVSHAEVAQKIHDLHGEGLDQKAISDQVSLDITHVGNILRWATADPIVWADEDDLQKKVVEARDKEKVSWAGIALRAGTTKSTVQKLYKAAGKDPHKSDIGKGGRRKDAYHSKKKAATKPKAKSGAKKGSGKKTPAKGKTKAKASTSKPKAKSTGGKKAASKSTGKTGGGKRTAKGSGKAKKEETDTPF